MNANSSLTPKSNDILLGRGKGSYEWHGTVVLMKLVSSYVPAYSAAKGKKDKISITEEILDRVKKTGSRFLAVDEVNGGLFEICDADARLKISQALRHRRSLAHDKKQNKNSADGSQCKIKNNGNLDDNLCGKSSTIDGIGNADGSKVDANKVQAGCLRHEGSVDESKHNDLGVDEASEVSLLEIDDDFDLDVDEVSEFSMLEIDDDFESLSDS
ncbi:hypothetical protein ACA910_004471 [Epithemia clementina (nom. ined.)]